jgi:hypothetical protein
LCLSNYPRLFERDVIVVVGGNASQTELESAQIIAAGLKELNGNEPVIVEDNSLGEDHKMGHNLILIGTPGSNDILGDIYNRTDATKVTSAYPGENKGLLEVLTNPWDLENSLLVVAGSDEWGVKAGAAALAQYQAFNERRVSVEWEEMGQTTSPYLSKTDATLDLLLTLRGEDQVPDEIREIIESDTVSVSINFSHVLDSGEIRSLEESGLRFTRLSGEVAHSGTIYGAEVPWDKLEDLVILESVIRVESTWQPGIHSPEN